MSCLFCKIINGEIPCYKVYEDENVLAFLDIAPINYGHTLVVTKKHFSNLEEISEKELVHLIIIVKKIGERIKTSNLALGYNIGFNNDPVAGQIIPHIHFHIIPRHEKDGLKHWPGGKYGDGEAEEILKKIKIEK